MGSLSSRPSVAAQTSPQVVYVPSPVYTPSPSTPNPDPSSPSITPEQGAAAARTGSLLQRSRGVFGTVQTSFRGLLDLATNSSNSGRKTLLGE